MTPTVCRICLSNEVQHVLKDLRLQELYERLTTVPFQMDNRPLALCYVCYAQLKTSYRFMLMCVQGEQRLAQWQVGEDTALDAIPSKLSISAIERTIVDSTVQGAYIDHTETVVVHKNDVKLKVEFTTDAPIAEVQELYHVTNSVQELKVELQASARNDDIENDKINIIRKQGLKKTNNVIAGEKIFMCDKCKNSFSNEREFIKHKLMRGCEKPYICIERSNLKKHALTHTGVKPHACNVCNLRFTLKVHLKQHARKHTRERSYVCNVCKKGFKKPSQLKRHVLIHTGERPYACNVCNRRFTLRGQLKQHAAVHTGEILYICDVCKKGFVRKSNLRNHVVTHMVEKSYVCDVCKKCFARKSYLTLHKLIHTKVKPYICNVCKKGFPRKRCLEVHAMLHSGEKPYSCKVCGKGFAIMSYLKAHAVTHTGEKPYICDVCKKSFYRKGSVTKHLARHK